SRERNGSIIPHIYFKDYGQNIYNLPSIPEQSKISSLFTYLDSLITLHQRKLSSLKNLKNRLLDRMFCDEKSQFPSIRFTEFTNAWEQDTAKNLFIPYRVKNSSNMNLVSYSVTNKDGFVNQNEYFDDGGKAVFADKKNSLIVSINTFAYNPSRINVGSLALYKHSEMGLVSPIYEVFQINNNNNPDFFLLWFRSEAFKNIVSTNSNKSVRDTLNLSQFESESVNFPNFAEQSKISSLFTHLDSLITLHQRKLLSLKNLKSRLLDRMFCDEKSQFPSIRFKEFTNAWEQKKLRNVVSYHSSVMIASDVKKYGKFDVYDPNKIVGKTDAEPFRSDYISIVKDGDAGRIRLLPKNTMILSTMGALIAKDPFKIDFLYYMLNAINDLARERNGSIIPHIYFKDYGQNIYNLPSTPEQSKISSLFTRLDSLITLHQRKLLSLKNLKSRLLDRMFCDEKSQFPSIRFKEFTNTWEQDTAKNLFIPYRVKNSSNMNLVSYSVTNKDGFVNQNEYFDDGGKAVFADKKNSLIVSINTFAYNPSRINVGSLALYKHSEMGLVSPIYEVFQINNNNNPDFFLLWFRSEAFKNIVSTNSNKSVRDTLNLSQFESESVNFPNFAEQSKISSLFTHLDSLITLHQRKRITRTV
ncbi:restriction endonuclease subunit S, partial [Mycoplasmopsis bovis]|uniref:restriction endonuclease subunit S n=4 Tax=Mycoplasmopsis bovis TaxID=28903 RepID=UPI003D286D3B